MAMEALDRITRREVDLAAVARRAHAAALGAEQVARAAAGGRADRAEARVAELSAALVEAQREMRAGRREAEAREAELGRVRAAKLLAEGESARDRVAAEANARAPTPHISAATHGGAPARAVRLCS